MTTQEHRPLRRDAARNRELILEAAHEVFAEHGLGGGFEEIARRAGVGVGTVYRRFPDKEALAEALFELRLRDMIAKGSLVARGDDSWVALTQFLTSTVEMQVADRGLRDVMLSTAFSGRVLPEVKAELIELVDGLIARAHDDGHLRPDFEGPDLAIIGGMLSDLATPDNPDLWRRYLGIVLDGMRSHGGAPTPLTVCSPTEDVISRVASGVQIRRRH